MHQIKNKRNSSITEAIFNFLRAQTIKTVKQQQNK